MAVSSQGACRVTSNVTDLNEMSGQTAWWKREEEVEDRQRRMKTVGKHRNCEKVEFLQEKCRKNWHTEERHTRALCHRSVCCHRSPPLCIRNGKAEVFLNSWLSCGNRTRAPARAQTFPADSGDGWVDNLVFSNCKQTEWQTVWVRTQGKTGVRDNGTFVSYFCCDSHSRGQGYSAKWRVVIMNIYWHN